MAHAFIDRENRTITITKAFNAKASIYGTKEYDELVTIQEKHPNFRLIIKPAKRTSIPLGRITFEQMEKYIENHDDKDKSRMAEYKKLRGLTDDDDEDEDKNIKNINEDEIQIKVSASFFEIKKWFVSAFPEILEDVGSRKKEVKKILKNVGSPKKENNEILEVANA